jgi:hypothetical protein
MNRVKYFCLVFFAVSAVEGFAQSGYQFISTDHNREIEKHAAGAKSNLHNNIQPYLNSDLASEINPDSLRGSSLFNWSNNMFLKTRVPEKGETRWRVFPMVTAMAGMDANQLHVRGTYEAGAGVGLGADFGKKLSVYADVFAQHGRYPLFLEQYMHRREVNPGKGYARWNGSGFSSWDYNAYLSYTPLYPFNIQLGVGKNFWGQGIRSLSLSDQATSYPFLKLNTSIWNIKYVNLFNVMYDIRGASGDYNRFALKYSTMHMLSWNISRRVNVSIWETVVWQNRDNDNLRGFDINYLNPIIFYRPVEFAQGSSDRVTIGINSSVKIWNNTQAYLQIAIDEFLLDSVRAGNGWFGNKQALQVGVKSFDAFKVKGLDLRGEFNLIRPFVYQHVSVKQNHAHFNEPLAHTLGNNLYEVILAAGYRKNRWVFDGRLVVAQYGTDPDSLNLGADLFRSDVDPVRPASGHRTGQGVEHWLASLMLQGAYVIDPHLGLRIEMAYMPRYLWVEGIPQYNHFFQVGVRTALWNRNRAF